MWSPASEASRGYSSGKSPGWRRQGLDVGRDDVEEFCELLLALTLGLGVMGLEEGAAEDDADGSPAEGKGSRRGPRRLLSQTTQRFSTVAHFQ